jgi:hypothetical protein
MGPVSTPWCTVMKLVYILSCPFGSTLGWDGVEEGG